MSSASLKVYIGLGSNLGYRKGNIRKAVSLLEGLGRISKISSIYETEPVGPVEQRWFLNAVVEIETDLEPRELLLRLKELERRIGRSEGGERWGPREIDLDILFYGDLVMEDEDLIIPHPRIGERRFVLEPLYEIAPDLIHPITGSTVSEMLKEVRDRHVVRRMRDLEVVRSISDMKEISKKLRQEGKVIGFVPTMGYLHEGHLSLIRESKRRCDITVVSIFVNPTQFGPSEDYERYPRDLERDIALSSSEGVDYLFVPEVGEMYPEGFCTYVEIIGKLTSTMCGRSRPTFFRGVTTVVTKLFNIVSPHMAFFGEKDFQQLQVVRRMVRDLNMDVEIVPVPTVREKDGLAMSSRNSYLSPEGRKAATILYRSLMAAKEMVEKGERAAARIKGMIEEMIRSEPLARIDYIAIVDSETLEDKDIVGPGTLIALAVWVEDARLIDNIVLRGDL